MVQEFGEMSCGVSHERVYGVVQEFDEMSYRVPRERVYVYGVVGDLVSCVPRIYGVVVGNLAICRSIVLCTRS